MVSLLFTVVGHLGNIALGCIWQLIQHEVPSYCRIFPLLYLPFPHSAQSPQGGTTFLLNNSNTRLLTPPCICLPAAKTCFFTPGIRNGHSPGIQPGEGGVRHLPLDDRRPQVKEIHETPWYNSPYFSQHFVHCLHLILGSCMKTTVRSFGRRYQNEKTKPK